MKIKAEKRLFWFLKDGVEIDLEDPSQLEMYVQQIITCGKTQDVKNALKILGNETFKEVLLKIRYYLPFEIRKFWEEFFGIN